MTTATTKWEELAPREREVLVSTHVLDGREVGACRAGELDKLVLERVRETWDGAAQYRMVSAFIKILRERGPANIPPGLRYQPGDYSRAALMVLGVVE